MVPSYVRTYLDALLIIKIDQDGNEKSADFRNAEEERRIKVQIRCECEVSESSCRYVMERENYSIAVNDCVDEIFGLKAQLEHAKALAAPREQIHARTAPVANQSHGFGIVRDERNNSLSRCCAPKGVRFLVSFAGERKRMRSPASMIS